MDKENMIFNESRLASILREEILKDATQEKDLTLQNRENTKFEYISTQDKSYISPLMTMDQDEILDFVEKNEVERLAKLTVAELDRISEVLGIEPSAFIEEFE